MTTTTATSTRCHRCGRVLRSATSIARGYGRTCSSKIAAAAKVVDLAAYKAEQQVKAMELIELGAIVRTGQTYLAVASDGSCSYEVDPAAGTCSCKAGQHGRPCYHLASALVLRAA